LVYLLAFSNVNQNFWQNGFILGSFKSNLSVHCCTYFIGCSISTCFMTCRDVWCMICNIFSVPLGRFLAAIVVHICQWSLWQPLSFSKQHELYMQLLLNWQLLCNRLCIQCTNYTLCSEKNTHSHFLSYLHKWCVDLNKNCSEYTQGNVVSDNREIRYSLQSMT